MARGDDSHSQTKGKILRHLFHLCAGSIPPLLALVLTREWLLIFLGTVAAIFVTIEVLRFLIAPLNQRLISRFAGASEAFKEHETARPIGSTYFMVGAFFTLLFFPRDIAVAALFFSAVGDAVAATVGERYGRTRLGSKSAEGTVAFFVSALIVGGILIVAGLRLNLVTVAVGALVAALVELIPIPFDDNLTIPLISASVMALALLIS
ncbi:MAG: hypothetical protein HYY30_01700 [Chloroflexi bacterium]|nr:hypothetical protein [Chloroflexota bacterium]